MNGLSLLTLAFLCLYLVELGLSSTPSNNTSLSYIPHTELNHSYTAAISSGFHEHATAFSFHPLTSHQASIDGIEVENSVIQPNAAHKPKNESHFSQSKAYNDVQTVAPEQPGVFDAPVRRVAQFIVPTVQPSIMHNQTVQSPLSSNSTLNDRTTAQPTSQTATKRNDVAPSTGQSLVCSHDLYWTEECQLDQHDDDLYNQSMAATSYPNQSSSNEAPSLLSRYNVTVTLPLEQTISKDQLKINLASGDTGAKVVFSSPTVLKASNILKSSKDAYMLVPTAGTFHHMHSIGHPEDNQGSAKVCAPNGQDTPGNCPDQHTISPDHKQLKPRPKTPSVIIQLSEAIQVGHISLVNFEHFSSNLKDFQVLGSLRYPTKKWLFLGHFRALNHNHLQVFQLPHPHFVRYLKIRLLTFYSDEQYCTVSNFGVYGSTMVETLEHQIHRNTREVEHTKLTEEQHEKEMIEQYHSDASKKYQEYYRPKNENSHRPSHKPGTHAYQMASSMPSHEQQLFTVNEEIGLPSTARHYRLDNPLLPSIDDSPTLFLDTLQHDIHEYGHVGESSTLNALHRTPISTRPRDNISNPPRDLSHTQSPLSVVNSQPSNQTYLQTQAHFHAKPTQPHFVEKRSFRDPPQNRDSTQQQRKYHNTDFIISQVAQDNHVRSGSDIYQHHFLSTQRSLVSSSQKQPCRSPSTLSFINGVGIPLSVCKCDHDGHPPLPTLLTQQCCAVLLPMAYNPSNQPKSISYYPGHLFDAFYIIKHLEFSYDDNGCEGDANAITSYPMRNYQHSKSAYTETYQPLPSLSLSSLLSRVTRQKQQKAESHISTSSPHVDPTSIEVKASHGNSSLHQLDRDLSGIADDMMATHQPSTDVFGILTNKVRDLELEVARNQRLLNDIILQSHQDFSTLHNHTNYHAVFIADQGHFNGLLYEDMKTLFSSLKSQHNAIITLASEMMSIYETVDRLTRLTYGGTVQFTRSKTVSSTRETPLPHDSLDPHSTPNNATSIVSQLIPDELYDLQIPNHLTNSTWEQLFHQLVAKLNTTASSTQPVSISEFSPSDSQGRLSKDSQFSSSSSLIDRLTSLESTLEALALFVTVLSFITLLRLIIRIYRIFHKIIFVLFDVEPNILQLLRYIVRTCTYIFSTLAQLSSDHDQDEEDSDTNVAGCDQDETNRHKDTSSNTITQNPAASNLAIPPLSTAQNTDDYRTISTVLSPRIGSSHQTIPSNMTLKSHTLTALDEHSLGNQHNLTIQVPSIVSCSPMCSPSLSQLPQQLHLAHQHNLQGIPALTPRQPSEDQIPVHHPRSLANQALGKASAENREEIPQTGVISPIQQPIATPSSLHGLSDFIYVSYLGNPLAVPAYYECVVQDENATQQHAVIPFLSLPGHFQNQILSTLHATNQAYFQPSPPLTPQNNLSQAVLEKQSSVDSVPE